MNTRKSKKLFYKESTKEILNENKGYVVAYINPHIVKQVVSKLEKTHKVKAYLLLA